MIRRRLRGAVESVALWSGVLARMEARARGHLTILTYHRVLPDERCGGHPFPSLVMPESAFRAQVAHLAENWRVLPVGEALRVLRDGDLGDKPLVAITFDDGYADNRAVAAPVLDAHGVKATFFVVTRFVADGSELWFDRAADALIARGDSPEQVQDAVESLKHLAPDARDARIESWRSGASEAASVAARRDTRPMDRADVRALAGAGHEIAAHSERHSILTMLDDAALSSELVVSRRELESWTGATVAGLAYPNGDHDERVVAHARAAGYEWACTTTIGRNDARTDPLRLARIDVTPRRVEDHRGSYSELAFRSEVSLLRESLRRRESRTRSS